MAKKKSNRKRNSKMTVSSVMDNIRKGLQIGGQGLDSREFEDSIPPRGDVPTPTPVPAPTPSPTPQMSTDGRDVITPTPAPGDKGGVPTPTPTTGPAPTPAPTPEPTKPPTDGDDFDPDKDLWWMSLGYQSIEEAMRDGWFIDPRTGEPRRRGRPGEKPKWWQLLNFKSLEEATAAGWYLDENGNPQFRPPEKEGEEWWRKLGLGYNSLEEATAAGWYLDENGQPQRKTDDDDDDDDDDDTTTPTPASEPTEEELREAALREKIEAQARGEVPDELKIPDADKITIGEDEILTTQEMDPLLKRVEFDPAKGVDPETVNQVKDIAQSPDPLEVKVSKIQSVVQVPENVAIQIAKGEVSNVANAIEVARINQIRSAEVEIEEGALAERVVGVLSPEAKAVAAKNAGTTLARVTRAKKQLRNAGLSEADINELGNDPETLEARLTDFTEQERGIIAGLPEEALVSNQFDSLISGMENGEIPAWAKPAVEAVEANLAQRGLSVSTVGRDALLNQIFRAALPIAQSNAQAIQQAITQQRGIEAQAAEADAQRQQQVSLQNAQNVFGLNMAQFNADQQRELSNSKFLQTVSLTNANNEQKSILQEAVLMSQANVAEANFAQQAQIQNAKNFLSMDIANLNAEQQVNVLKAQQEQQRILSNQASENARRQFNATSDNQVQQFNASLAAEVERANVQQMNAINQFNVSQQNAAAARDAQREADLNQFNARLATQIEQFNSNQDFARNQFNAQNRAAVEASNVQWRRQVNTANTAAQNAVNMQNAMNAFNMSQTALSFMWQELRDKADFDFRSSENEKNRIAQLVNTALASDPNKYGSSTKGIEALIALIVGDVTGG